MKLLRYSILILVFSSAGQVMAQTQHTGWFAAFNTFKLNKKFSIHADAQLRSTDELEQVQTILFRTGLNIHLNKQMVLTTGYAFIENKTILSSQKGFLPEHRIWEQFIYNHRLSRLYVTHRARLEQRFIPVAVISNNEVTADSRHLSNRFRYFLRNMLPFKSGEKFTNGMFAALQNEVFVNVSNKERVNGKFFDQNRLYLAVGYRVSPKFDIEAGYLNQYVSRRTRRLNNHAVQVATYLRL